MRLNSESWKVAVRVVELIREVIVVGESALSLCRLAKSGSFPKITPTSEI
jgi:hypothetical protein